MSRVAFVIVCLFLVRSAHADDGMPCVSFSAQNIEDARKFWTLEEQEKASPAVMPPLSPEERLEFDRAMLLVQAAKLKLLPFSRSAFLAFIASAHAAVLPSAVTSAPVTDPPFNASGRLSFSDTGGRPGWCTASFVGDVSVIMTAAHCVANSGGFYSRLQFSRAFVQGVGGENFAISSVGVNQQWVAKGADEFDYAFLRTATAVTSATPLTFASGAPGGWIGIGYPNLLASAIAQPLGQEMMYAAGSNATPSGYTMYIMDGDPMGSGASGGAWIPPPSAPFGGAIVTVTARNPRANVLLGPILDSRATKLFDKVKAACQ